MSTTADDTPAERPGGPAGPPAPRPGAPPDPGVAVILWPEEEQRRRRLEVAGIPRLLVIAGGEPPADLDVVLEDWVRVPVEQPDLDRRVAILAARSGVATPFIDDGDLLHCGGRWVALPASEARLAVPLVEHFGNLVAMESLLATAEPDKPSSLRAIRVGIARLRRRIAPLGLTIATVRARGYSMGALRPDASGFGRNGAAFAAGRQ